MKVLVAHKAPLDSVDNNKVGPLPLTGGQQGECTRVQDEGGQALHGLVPSNQQKERGREGGRERCAGTQRYTHSTTEHTHNTTEHNTHNTTQHTQHNTTRQNTHNTTQHTQHNTTQHTPAQMTPLHLAARNGHVDVVRLLLDSNASLKLTNADGETALVSRVTLCAGHRFTLPFDSLASSSLIPPPPHTHTHVHSSFLPLHSSPPPRPSPLAPLGRGCAARANRVCPCHHSARAMGGGDG